MMQFAPRLLLFAIQLLALTGAAVLYPGGATAGPVRQHKFTVAIDPDLKEIGVRACFVGPAPASLVAESLDAPLALIEARVEGAREAIEPSGSLSLKTVPDGGCIAYRVNVSRPISLHDKSGAKVRRVGRDLLTSVGLWLWRPEKLGPDEQIEIEFRMPDGIAVSAPWAPVTGAARPTFLLGDAPFDWPASVAFGRFREHELRIGGARLRLAILDGRPAPDIDQMAAWIADAAQMVADLHGRFPLSQAQILVVPDTRGGEPTPWAYVVRGGSPAVHFFVNQRRPIQEFFEDWTATHELAHLLLPFVSFDDAWLSEGIATYYQNVLRARAGKITAQQAWSEMHVGFLHGRSNAPELTLAQATENMYHGRTFMRVYWEGAAIILLADVRLRQLTAGKQSMDTALAALNECCMQVDRQWSARELMAKLDEITGTGVFSQLYEAHVGSKEFPDLDAVYRQLGIIPGRAGIEFAPDAPQSRLRDAIMQGGALFLSFGLLG